MAEARIISKLAADNPQDAAMITLFQFPAAFNVPNASPYCLKLETWLRLAGLEYQVKVVSDPRKAPKGKLPYVRIEGEAIGDSEIVIRTLGERYEVTLDAGLDARGKGWARAITRLCDEHLYYLMLYFRWFDEDSWRVLKPVFFGSLPFGVRDAVAWAMRRKVRATLRAQGLGVHGRDELLAFARDDLDALDGLLGQGPVLRRRTSVQRRCRRLRYPRQPHRGDPGYPTQPCGARLSAPGGVLRADAGAGLE